MQNADNIERARAFPRRAPEMPAPLLLRVRHRPM